MTRQTRLAPAPKSTGQERRWLLFTDRSVHGIKHSELTMLRKIAPQQTVRSTVSVFTISKPFALGAGLLLLALLLVLAGCVLPPTQKGGQGKTQITRPWQTNAVSFSQSDNPSTPSRQTVQSEQTIEYGSRTTGLEQEQFAEKSWHALPGRSGHGPRDRRPQRSAGIAKILGIPGSSSSSSSSSMPEAPLPLRIITKDRTDTTIGAAQKDSVREWAGKARNLQPVMWAGIVMMTLVAGILAYFGWWTKAGVAAAVGIGMVVLAQTLPGHGGIILFGGLGIFAFVALLVLYSYYKGQLDRNGNGIPDFIERRAQPSPLLSH